MKYALSVFAAALAAAFAFAEPPVAASASRLVPMPKSVSLDYDHPFALTDRTPVSFSCAKAADAADAQEFVRRALKDWFGVKASFAAISSAGPAAPAGGTNGAYRVRTADGRLAIMAADLDGARYAMDTLRQLADPVPGSERLAGYQVPALAIDDAPAMRWRGIHFCWFPENTALDMERYIRLAASYKYNYVVLESWGMFRSPKHPGLSWPESPMTVRECRRLAALAKELGVTLVPQLNIFGHASGSRWCCGKHCALDLHPELQPLFEPLGWNWCLSNPAAKRTIEDLVIEMHDAFGRPPYFHVGCDEAVPPSCSLCRKTDYHAVVAGFITHIHDVLAARGCATMLWHDMFIRRDLPVCRGMVANGGPAAEKMLDGLPKDVIVCDWQYGAPAKGVAWPTMLYFKNKGFRVLACPWENRAGTFSQGAFVGANALDGLLATTWHHLTATKWKIIADGARAAWEGGDGKAPVPTPDEVLAHHLRQVGWDAGVKDYRDAGWVNRQLDADTNAQSY